MRSDKNIKNVFKVMLIKNDKIVQGALEYNKKKLDFVEDEEINE
jgi:hypothetical protein